jgi:hypothetical protein
MELQPEGARDGLMDDRRFFLEEVNRIAPDILRQLASDVLPVAREVARGVGLPNWVGLIERAGSSRQAGALVAALRQWVRPGLDASWVFDWACSTLGVWVLMPAAPPRELFWVQPVSALVAVRVPRRKVDEHGFKIQPSRFKPHSFEWLARWQVLGASGEAISKGARGPAARGPFRQGIEEGVRRLSAYLGLPLVRHRKGRRASPS